MRFATLATACTLALASSTSVITATECTADQLVAMTNSQESEGYVAACKSLDVFRNLSISQLSETQVAGLAPCGEATCLTTIRKVIPLTPDCTVGRTNFKAVMEATLTMCEKFAKGPLTKAEVEELFKGTASNSTNQESGSAANETAPAEVKPPTLPETTDASKDASGSPAVTTTVPSPAPTPKSSASGVVVASTVIVAAVATALL